MFHVEHCPTDMKEFLAIINDYCAQNGLSLDARQQQQIVRYAEFLVEYNQKVNLTAITEPKEMAVKHFADSLSLATAVTPAGKLLDLGTGAGFPGMVMKVLFPNLNVTLMDSVGKKVEFLRQLADELGVEVTLLCGRAEDFAKKPELREQFDVVTARAVAALPTLCEYCLPFVKVGGIFASMKGSAFADELAQAENAIRVLGGHTRSRHPLSLPDGSQRGIIVIEKISHTSTQYPRNGGQISKKPL